MRVSYLDDEQDEGDGYTSNTSGRKTVYAGQVVDCNLEQMALFVLFPGEDEGDWATAAVQSRPRLRGLRAAGRDGRPGPAERATAPRATRPDSAAILRLPRQVSLLEDDWEWTDGGRPSMKELTVANKRRRAAAATAAAATVAAGSVAPGGGRGGGGRGRGRGRGRQQTPSSSTSGPPPPASTPPPPPPPKVVDLNVDSVERTHQLLAMVKALRGPNPQRAAAMLQRVSRLGVYELALMVQLGAVAGLMYVLQQHNQSEPVLRVTNSGGCVTIELKGAAETG